MSGESFSSLMARARLLMEEGRYREALEYLLQAEALARDEYGPDDKRLAAALDKLSVVYKELGHDIEAERATDEATRILLMLKRLQRRGELLSQQQKYKDAEPEYREALRICERVYGPAHSETATCADSLATCLRAQSRFVEAVTLAKRALEIRLTVYGEEHAATAASFSNLGLLYRCLEQYDQAQRLQVKSLVIRERIYGTDHARVAESLDRLASLLRDLGRFDEAITHGERCLRIRKDKLGADHPLTGAAMHNLAMSRERRQGESLAVAAQAAGGDGGNDTPPVPVVVAATPELPPEGHRAGLWISAALLAGGLAAAVAFWFIPVAGVLIGIAVIAIGCAALVGLISIESLMLRLVGRLKQAMAEPEVDRDAVVLGALSLATTGTVELESTRRKGALTDKDARELLQTGMNPLDLSFVHSLTQAAADVLAKHKGTLMLNGLREVRSKLAKSLRWHKGRLELNGVPELTEAAAAHIARHEGDLALSGIRSLPSKLARHLAHHKGTLELDGLRTLDEAAAEWIVKHRGPVFLRGCTLLSSQTKRILRSAPLIDFPGRQDDGPAAA